LKIKIFKKNRQTQMLFNKSVEFDKINLYFFEEIIYNFSMMFEKELGDTYV
jgi:hypothetical protein